MKTYSFEKLEVWKESKALAIVVYRATEDFPKEERYGLISQMRRSSISIPSNIAEGTSRYSARDQIRFYELAYGSLMELLNQILISYELEFVFESTVSDLRNRIDSIAMKLSKLRKSALQRPNQ